MEIYFSFLKETDTSIIRHAYIMFCKSNIIKECGLALSIEDFLILKVLCAC